MANYNAVSKTGEFTVTDEEKYQKLFAELECDGDQYDLSETDSDGHVMHRFGGYGSFYLTKNGESNIENFLSELQPLLPDGTVFTYTEIGYEKLRCVSAYSVCATNAEICYISLDDLTEETAKAMAMS